MTTHLVIADQDTLDALAVESAENPDVLHVNHREAYLNGDRWLFRTPESAAVDKADYWYVQGQPAGRGYVLPLIAAADLLGVDEL